MATDFDYLIIGAGIAGVPIAAHLAKNAVVAVVEMEATPAYHTTGRSAASYEPNYGPAPMLAFTRSSGEFFRRPPAGFAAAPLFTPRGSLVLDVPGQERAAEKFLANAKGLQEMSVAEIMHLIPAMRPDYATRGFYDDQTGDLDVDQLHQSYLKLFKARGGQIYLDAPVKTVVRKNGRWRASTATGEFSARVLVNAAGAWADHVAQLAGLAGVGLIAKRRSIGVFPVLGFPDFDRWPFVTDCAESWYMKPQSGAMIVSSADATPVEPHDAYADDMAIAEGVDRMMQATTLEVTRLSHSWGGLRVFSPDGSPVIGFDPRVEGFFWLAGLGGYGIQSSPALSRNAALMAQGKPVEDDVIKQGLVMAHILPERFC